MNELVMRLTIDPARAYVIHKGRLPKDAGELMEWLNEYADWQRKSADAILRAYEDHMANCTRPLIIKPEPTR